MRMTPEQERQFLAALQARDIALKSGQHLVVNDTGDLQRWQRCVATNKANDNTDASYQLHCDGPAPWALFHNWTDGRGVSHWRGENTRALTEAELAELDRRTEEAEMAAEKIATAEAAEAAALAQDIFEDAVEAPTTHPYLQAKNIKPHGVRVDEQGCLLVPVVSPEHELVSLQLIARDGSKWFLRGGRVKGCAFEIEGSTDTVVEVEGFATGATINEAGLHSVIIAFHSGNLINVARTIRSRIHQESAALWQIHEAAAAERGLRHARELDFKLTTIVVAADDDWRTKGNPGIMKALQAAREAKALIAVPDFGKERGEKETDFNDLAAAHGIKAVKEDISNAVAPQILIEDILSKDPYAAYGDAWVKELAAYKQSDAAFYEKLLARLKKAGARARELDTAVKNTIKADATKAAAARARKRPVELDPDALAASAADIIESDDVLSLFADEVGRIIVGEQSLIKILYLAGTSRLFDKAMHVAIKGPSAAGKSEVRRRVLDYFPPECVFAFTSLSERALLYIADDFEHKILE